MRKTICTVLILVLALTAVGGCGKKELSEEDMKAAEVVNPADLDALSTEAAVWENDAKRGFYFRKNVPYTTSKAEERTLNLNYSRLFNKAA